MRVPRLIRPAALIGLGGLLAIATAASTASPQGGTRRFGVASVFLELNDTDGDLGLHAAIDGAIWTSLRIEAPDESRLLDITTAGPLRRQGLTQLGIESAEPPFDELAPADFFARFPEGWYEIEARGQDGGTIEGRSRLSHVLAAPPDNVTLSGVPAAEDCDAAPLPVVPTPVVIRWDAVTTSHPEIGRTGSVSIAGYQVFVERIGTSLGVDLPPTVTAFEVPAALTAPGQPVKFEIIARTATGNNTAVESCFRVM